MNALYQRHCLRLFDFTTSEIKDLIKMAKKLKKNKKNNNEKLYLKKKNIVLIFEKESTRTRCSFEVAAFDQGANTTYLGPGNSHLGYKESIKDTAKVLSRIYDGIEYRGNDHKTIEILSKYSSVPVWNGLTNKFHPTQLLADLLTMQEYQTNKKFNSIKCAYVGDANNNISNTMLEAAALLGLDLRFVAPKQYWPNEKLFSICEKKAKKNKGKIICTENIRKGVENVDFIYTDVWISMGEEKEIWVNKINLLKHYQVNKNMLLLTNNPHIKVLHCLPSFHDKYTTMGKEIIEKYSLENEIEITNEVFESYSNIILEQSENRLHTIKALMIATLSQSNNLIL